MRSPEGESGPARETADPPAGAPDERTEDAADGHRDAAGAAGHAAPYPSPERSAPSPPQYGPGPYPPPHASGPHHPPPYPAAPYPGFGPAPVGQPPPSAPGRYAAGHPAGPYGAPPYPYPAYGPPAGLGPDAAPPGRPRRTHRWGLGAFVLAEAVFLGVSLLVTLVLGQDAGVAALGAAVALPTVLAAAVAVLATRLRGNGPRVDLGLVWSWRDLAIGLAFGFGGLVVALIASAVFVSLVGPDVTSAVGDLLGDQRAGPAAALMILLIVVLVAPLCEEILYRGLLWGACEKLGAGRWVAFGVTTLAFALLHFEFTRAPLLLVVSIPIGLARLYTGRLLASIVAHQVNNLLPGIALYLMLTGALAA